MIRLLIVLVLVGCSDHPAEYPFVPAKNWSDDLSFRCEDVSTDIDDPYPFRCTIVGDAEEDLMNDALRTMTVTISGQRVPLSGWHTKWAAQKSGEWHYTEEAICKSQLNIVPDKRWNDLWEWPARIYDDGAIICHAEDFTHPVEEKINQDKVSLWTNYDPAEVLSE